MVRELDALNENRVTRGIQIGSIPLHRIGVVKNETPLFLTLLIKHHYRNLLAFDVAEYNLLVPIPKIGLVCNSPLEREIRVARLLRMLVYVVVETTFTVFVHFSAHFESRDFRKTSDAYVVN